MTGIKRLTLVLLVLATASLSAQGRFVWDDLYREAIRHVQRKEWKDAEAKLLESKKTGPESGRGVIRRGLLGRDDYFPEFYLGVVFVNTGRPALAIPQFQIARKRGLNPKDGAFRQIGEFESTAAAMMDAEVKAKPIPVDPRPQFKTLIDQAQRFLAESRYDDAEDAARQARGLNVDNAAVDTIVQTIDIRRRTARLQQQLTGNPSLAELGRLLTEYENTGVSVDDVRRRIAAAEAGEARATAERTGMIEFYSGNYQRALTLISDAEKIAPLTARGNFYRACSLASLATRGKATNQAQLREARRYYAIAAQQPDAFKNDLRYISPRLLQLLQAS